MSGWLNLQMQNHRYRELAWIMRILHLCGGSVPLPVALFRGQLYTCPGWQQVYFTKCRRCKFLYIKGFVDHKAQKRALSNKSRERAPSSAQYTNSSVWSEPEPSFLGRSVRQSTHYCRIMDCTRFFLALKPHLFTSAFTEDPWSHQVICHNVTWWSLWINTVCVG